MPILAELECHGAVPEQVQDFSLPGTGHGLAAEEVEELAPEKKDLESSDRFALWRVPFELEAKPFGSRDLDGLGFSQLSKVLVLASDPGVEPAAHGVFRPIGLGSLKGCEKEAGSRIGVLPADVEAGDAQLSEGLPLGDSRLEEAESGMAEVVPHKGASASVGGHGEAHGHGPGSIRLENAEGFEDGEDSWVLDAQGTGWTLETQKVIGGGVLVSQEEEGASWDMGRFLGLEGGDQDPASVQLDHPGLFMLSPDSFGVHIVEGGDVAAGSKEALFHVFHAPAGIGVDHQLHGKIRLQVVDLDLLIIAREKGRTSDEEPPPMQRAVFWLGLGDADFEIAGEATIACAGGDGRADGGRSAPGLGAHDMGLGFGEGFQEEAAFGQALEALLDRGCATRFVIGDDGDLKEARYDASLAPLRRVLLRGGAGGGCTDVGGEEEGSPGTCRGHCEDPAFSFAGFPTCGAKDSGLQIDPNLWVEQIEEGEDLVGFACGPGSIERPDKGPIPWGLKGLLLRGGPDGGSLESPSGGGTRVSRTILGGTLPVGFLRPQMEGKGEAQEKSPNPKALRQALRVTPRRSSA